MKSSNFPKYHWKNLIDFCPGRFYRLGTCDLFWLFSRRLYSGECITYLVWINFHGRIYQKILVVFWKIDDFINTFWLHLTFCKLSYISFRLQFISLRSVFYIVSYNIELKTNNSIQNALGIWLWILRYHCSCKMMNYNWILLLKKLFDNCTAN